MIKRRSEKNKIQRRRQKHLLGVEKTPPTLNTTELSIFPGLIEVLEEEVAGAVVVSLADEGVKERLEVRLRSG